jgi:hypothetical protein
MGSQMASSLPRKKLPYGYSLGITVQSSCSVGSSKLAQWLGTPLMETNDQLLAG